MQRDLSPDSTVPLSFTHFSIFQFIDLFLQLTLLLLRFSLTALINLFPVAAARGFQPILLRKMQMLICFSSDKLTHINLSYSTN